VAKLGYERIVSARGLKAFGIGKLSSAAGLKLVVMNTNINV
jgi:hypothetical protein